MNKTRILLAGAALAAAALAVQAQTQAPAASAAAASAAPASVLSIRQIHDSLEAAGYRNITAIELDRGRYEVKASDKQARRVEIDVNASSGAIERTELDD